VPEEVEEVPEVVTEVLEKLYPQLKSWMLN